MAIVAGLVMGSLLGELLAQVASAPWLRDLLTRGPTIGLTTPATLDLKLLAVTFGIVFKVNVVGVLGIIIAVIAFRRL